MSEVVAIFDGRCVICNTTRRIVQALDWRKQVTFMDLHDGDSVTRRYPSLDTASLMGEIHVVADGGRVYAGFNGTRRLMKAAPLLLPLWALMHLPVVRGWIGPAIYRFIARNRYSINRWLGVELSPEDDCADDICVVPGMERPHD
jgi:predicted DCC family thiol-disulfide oxidoreductase YuxK